MGTITCTEDFEVNTDADDDTFSFMLTQGEVDKVNKKQYLDFLVIFKRHQKSPYAIDVMNATASTKPDMMEAMPITECVRIFCA